MLPCEIVVSYYNKCIWKSFTILFNRLRDLFPQRSHNLPPNRINAVTKTIPNKCLAMSLTPQPPEYVFWFCKILGFSKTIKVNSDSQSNTTKCIYNFCRYISHAVLADWCSKLMHSFLYIHHVHFISSIVLIICFAKMFIARRKFTWTIKKSLIGLSRSYVSEEVRFVVLSYLWRHFIHSTNLPHYSGRSLIGIYFMHHDFLMFGDYQSNFKRDCSVKLNSQTIICIGTVEANYDIFSDW